MTKLISNIEQNHFKNLSETVKKEIYRAKRYNMTFTLGAIYTDNPEYYKSIKNLIRPTDILLSTKEVEYKYIIFAHTNIKDATKACDNMLLNFNQNLSYKQLQIGLAELNHSSTHKSIINRSYNILEFIRKGGFSRIETDIIFDLLV